MAHRPNQSLIIVVNADGSGYVLQFETSAEAKDAYRAISTDGAAYLYAGATKSLSSKPAGSPAPISSTGVDIPTVGGIAGEVKKGMTFFQNQNASFDTGQNMPPLPRVTVSSPFDQRPYEQWQNFCKLNPDNPQCTTGSNPKFGTLISSSCEINHNYLDKNDKSWTVAPVKANVYANGIGGQYTEYPYEVNTVAGGCFYPKYFATKITDWPLFYNNVNDPKGTINVAIYTQNPTVNGDDFIDYSAIQDIVLGDVWTTYGGQDGSGNEKNYVICGVPTIGDDFKTLIDYESGAYLRDVNFPQRLHPKSVTGWSIVTHMHKGHYSTGDWFVDFLSYNGTVPADTELGQNTNAYPRNITLRFRYKPKSDPIDPFEVIPASGAYAGRAILNEYTQEFEGISLSETIVPTLSIEYDYSTVYVEELDETANCGESQKSTVDNVIDGPYVSGWSDMKYYDYGTVIASDGGNDACSDGGGGYFMTTIEPHSCPYYGVLLDSTVHDLYANAGCGNWTIGSQYDNTYADGNCGNYIETNDTYVPNGTYVGDCNNYKYYSDGNGGVYQGGSNCPTYGTDLGYILNYLPETNGTPYTLGYQAQPAMADGNCGAWAGAGSTTWIANGTLVYSDNSNNYFSDGNGGYYVEGAST